MSWKRVRAFKPGSLAPLLRLAALMIGVLAVAAVTRAALRSRETPERVRARLEELAALSAMSERVSGWQAAQRGFARETKASRPFDLAAQVVELPAGDGVTNPPPLVSRMPVAGGWEQVCVQFRSDNLALAALSPLIEAAEAADPPWRLNAIAIEPISPRPGKGRVTLAFETVTRRPESGSVPEARHDGTAPAF